MRPVPIPPEVLARSPHGRVVTIGDPARGLTPCEYLVLPSDVYPGHPAFSVLLELDENDRAAAADGRRLWLRLDGVEAPWTLAFEIISGSG